MQNPYRVRISIINYIKTKQNLINILATHGINIFFYPLSIIYS